LTVLLLSLLLPAVLLVMLRLLERYERTLDKPYATDDDVEFGTEAPAGAVPHPRVMPLPAPLTEPVTETA
jgi:hypothetical protein